MFYCPTMLSPLIPIMMPPKKHSKRFSKDNLTHKDGPPTVATKPGCSAVLDALDCVEELEDKLEEQVDSELEDNIEDSNDIEQNKQRLDSVEGGAEEEEESSGKDAPVVILQKRVIKAGAPTKAKSLYPTSSCFSSAEPLSRNCQQYCASRLSRSCT